MKDEEESCEFCREKFDHTIIKEYNNWTLQLFLDQQYLARTLIKLDRHIVDFFNIKEEERKELFQIIVPEVKTALNQLFDPDLYNYASLGNDCRHLHLHLIPRYSSEREFMGQKFVDQDWNSHYKNDRKSEELTQEIFQELKTEIKQELE